MKNADMTGEKNERKKTVYSSRYNGQFIICEGTFSDNPRYQKRNLSGFICLSYLYDDKRL